jgi:cytochrome P450
MHSEAVQCLQRLLQSPELYDTHFQTYSYGVIARCFFGLHIDSPEHHFVLENESFISEMMQGFDPTVFPVNIFPFLRYLPTWALPSLRKMEGLRALTDEQVGNLQRNIEQQHSSSTPTDQPGIFNEFLANRKNYDISDIEANNAFSALIGGGTRSPHNALLTFVYLMMAYPEWQTKLQAQVDGVVGSQRLPNWDDIPNLPLVRAVVKEGIRYRSIVAELGIPHALDEDDVYEGFHFKKGTVFHANYAYVSSCAS